MSKASDAGKSFLAGVLAKISDPEKRAQAEAILADSNDALEVIGTGALGQADINRRYNELTELDKQIKDRQSHIDDVHARQTEWWDANKDTITTQKAEIDRLMAGKDKSVTSQPSVDELRKELNEKILSLQREGVGVMAFMTDLGIKHYAEFGEKPDMTALLADPKLGKENYTLVDAYRTKYGTQIEERAKKVEDARIDKIVQERMAEERKKYPQPFPLRGESPAPIDVLESTTDKPENHTVDSATALYEQLQAARG